MGEVVGAGEEVGGYGVDGVGAVGFGLGTFGCGEEFGFGESVEGAEGGVIGGAEHAAAAGGGGAVLAEGLAIGFMRHRYPFLLGLCGAE